MSTSSLAQPSAAMTDSASAREAGDDVRYGIITASRRSAPIASATRYATTAESIPPDRAEHGPLEAGLLELAADELADHPARDVGVDRQLARQLERRHGLGGRFGRGHAPRSPLRAGRGAAPGLRRTASVAWRAVAVAPWSPFGRVPPRSAASACRHLGRGLGRDVRLPWTPNPIGIDGPPAGTRSKPGSAPRSAFVSIAWPDRSATIRLSSRTCSSSRSSRRSGSAIRSRRMSAVGMSTRYSPSS